MRNSINDSMNLRDTATINSGGYNWKITVGKIGDWGGKILFNARLVWGTLGAVLLLALLWLALGNFGFANIGDFPLVSSAKWQAVFLTNGQAYFGHLKNYNRKYVALSDVYYLQAGQPLQQGQQAVPNLNLVKLGGELHGPEDVMYIPKDKILFWENMKNDAQVTKAIESTRR